MILDQQQFVRMKHVRPLKTCLKSAQSRLTDVTAFVDDVTISVAVIVAHVVCVDAAFLASVVK